ncbi:hypothetical protein TREAZ_2987 [Leadbettera azotonutricia ZAS-9]|uniref:Uncharacterized protein n=1 Tax=Leadbettera azotonutricia (strain ATCC BAA-888 / DSM 13862 / ZAS-9) TaxID=545695 RepID=F5YB81_LEAAZ|nr:hypothetical protein TREAZ_2987 [Leadbettera azotonutricia ZAS-9]
MPGLCRSARRLIAIIHFFTVKSHKVARRKGKRKIPNLLKLCVTSCDLAVKKNLKAGIKTAKGCLNQKQ